MVNAAPCQGEDCRFESGLFRVEVDIESQLHSGFQVCR